MEAALPETINWGIIGCGDVTERKSGPALQRIPGSRLVAVMRRDAAKARDYAERHGVPRWYDRVESLLRDPEVNAIYVATPPSTHAAYTLQALAAGKPVYVEKPMATTLAETQAMIAAADAAGLPLFVAHYRRALPNFVQIKRWLEEEKLGTVLAARTKLVTTPPADTSQWRLQKDLAGGGLLYDLGSHTLDLLDWWFGPATRVEGRSWNRSGFFSVEDVTLGELGTASGVPCSCFWAFAAHPSAACDEIEIIGTRGRLLASTFAETHVRLETEAGAEDFAFSYPASVQEPLLATVVQSLLEKRMLCPSNGVSASRTNGVLEILGRQE